MSASSPRPAFAAAPTASGYDNGQRHDGTKVRKVVYPSRRSHQGPQHHVGRPGHAAHQDPRRGLNAAQLETLAELAEEYSDGIATSPRARTSSCITSTS